MTNKTNEALFRESETDYVLKEDWHSVWITVDEVSIYIHRRPGGAQVDAYVKGMETDDPLDGFFIEGDVDESNNPP